MAMRLTLGHIDELDDSALASPGNQGWAGCTPSCSVSRWWSGAGPAERRGCQDQVVVESQRPERVPFDLAAELHLRFDAVAVAYRKAMRDLGLAASAPTGISAE
jgi:hypothetical protein